MIDHKDSQILRLLQENARFSNAEIGERVSLSASTVFERVKKMQNAGVIKGYVAVVDAESVGKPVAAFVRLTVNAPPGESYQACKQDFLKACLAEADVLECHGVAGEDCYILKVRVVDPAGLETLIERLRGHNAVSRSISSIVLSTHKETTLIEPVVQGS